MAKESAKSWREKIEEALRYREEFGDSGEWETFRAYCRGDFPSYSKSTSIGGLLPLNLTYAMSQTLIAHLYFRNPGVSAIPRNPRNFIAAKVVEQLLNYLIQELAIKPTMRTAILDAYQCGRGILKVGYSSEYSAEPKEEDLEWDARVKTGFPWVKRVDPYNFLVPFGTRILDECEWIDHLYLRKTKDVSASKKYKNTAGLTGTHLGSTMKMKGRMAFVERLKRTAPYTELHEIRDARRGEVLVLIPGSGNKDNEDRIVAGPMDDVLQTDGFNFADFCFNEDTDFYWAPSDCKIIQPQQLEVNELRTQAMYHRRIALLKFLVQEGSIDDEELQKMLDDEPGAAVKVKGDPNTVVTAMQPHISPEFMMYAQELRQDFREILGWSRQAMGEAPPGRRTATEMQFVSEAMGTRVSARRDVVADALQKLLRKVLQIIFKFWPAEQVIPVVGFDGAKYWVSLNKEDLSAEYDIRIDVESMVPSTKKARRAELVQLIQALGKNPQANLSHLMRMLLREFEWVDAMSVLPEAQETQFGERPMSSGQFQRQQRGLLENPAVLASRAAQNAPKAAAGMGVEGA